MTSTRIGNNCVRDCRLAQGLTQAQLAASAGISRSAVTAIESNRLVPSVAAALALAQALSTTVERLFGTADAGSTSETWAWSPRAESRQCWRAEVSGKTVLYPADSVPMLSMLPDRDRTSGRSAGQIPDDTLVMASCDPAAGILASQFASATGLRLLVLPRPSRLSVEMLRDGLVHLAGLHLSTHVDPDRNTEVARSTLRCPFQMLRLTQWQEGITLAPTSRLRSVRSVMKAKLSWIGRETGSGARQCLDRLLQDRPAPRRVARNHRHVVDAVHSGWADAGVCVRLVSEEAGLTFLPVQEEMFDVCYRLDMATDRRIRAFVKVVQSAAYRRLLGNLPGYDCAETGNVWNPDSET